MGRLLGTVGAHRTAAWTAAFAIALAACVAALASLGESDGTVCGLTALYLVVAAGLPAVLYVLGGIGLGRVFAPLTRGARDPAALQAGLGLALMLSLSHGLGCLGLLDASGGRVVAIGLCVVGMALLVFRRAAVAPPAPIFLLIPAFAVLLTAAVQPPGWLWRSEFGGFDALSYHLQLPQEWLLRGRIEPLTHNVYSYLPGYVEAAFLHIGVLAGAPAWRPGSPAYGLVAGDGLGALSCQFLHVGFAVASAWLLTRCVRLAAGEDGPSGGSGRVASWAAAAVFLGTPWIVVVGSLAYNDLGVVVLGAAAFAAALDSGLSPWRRGLTAGLLVGVACGCKPTALLFLGMPVAVLLLGRTEVRRWGALAAVGCAAGLAALAPWLIRNGVYAGNPVFPYLTGWFGTAHWTAEQAERFARATFYQGGFVDRIALLVLEDPQDPAGARHRGLFHPQWLVFFPLTAAALIGVLACARSRWLGLLLAAGLLTQLAAWLYASHLQSRFLIPLTIPSTVLLGVAGARFLGVAQARGLWLGRGAAALLAGAALVHGGASVWAFAQQNGGRPNSLLIAGAGIRTGALWDSWEQADAAGVGSPEVYANLALPPGRVLYLLGDATPLYYAPPVMYHTVWDRSPLAEAARAHPDEPSRWGEGLRRADVRYVLVNFAELARYRRSGYLDAALTPEVVERFLGACGRLVREWPGGRALFELAPGAAGSAP